MPRPLITLEGLEEVFALAAYTSARPPPWRQYLTDEERRGIYGVFNHLTQQTAVDSQGNRS